MSNDKGYTIAEISKLVGYEAHVIRFYEKEFNLTFPRNKANHRYFTHKEIQQLQNIKTLQEKGYSNTQIKLILSNPDLLSGSNIEINDIAATNYAPVPKSDLKHLEEYIDQVKREIIEDVKNQLEFHQQPYRMALTGLAEEVKELTESLHSDGNVELQENILLCENAKLKMQIKQNIYEIQELKEKLAKVQKRKKPIWERIITRSNV